MSSEIHIDIFLDGNALFDNTRTPVLSIKVLKKKKMYVYVYTQPIYIYI